MANHKKFLASVDATKSLRKKVAKDRLERMRLVQERKAREEEKLRKGLAGQKLGRHVVQEGNIDVQLGEELSESLRALKVCRRLVLCDICLLFFSLQPEGNLFRDRFLSMQQRALIEPRAPVWCVSSPFLFIVLLRFVTLRRSRKQAKTKEYEKHAYKRFDRDN